MEDGPNFGLSRISELYTQNWYSTTEVMLTNSRCLLVFLSHPVCVCGNCNAQKGHAKIQFLDHLSVELQENRAFEVNANTATSVSAVVWDFSEAISSIMTKVEMPKDIHLQIWKLFAVFKCEKILRWKIQTKPIYELVIYCLAFYSSFLPPQMANIFHTWKWQNVFTFANKYFLPFRLYHNRRNGFCPR